MSNSKKHILLKLTFDAKSLKNESIWFNPFIKFKNISSELASILHKYNDLNN